MTENAKKLLRPWREEDAPDLAAALNNPCVQAELRDGLPLPYTERDAAAYIRAARAADPRAVWSFAITEQGRAVGCISAARGRNISRRSAELGYYLAEPCWGRGLATAAVRQMSEYLFASTDLARLFAEVFAENRASCRVLEKAGFRREGVLRRSAVKDGRLRDMCLYALLREELRAR